ncbi:molybdopterin molybdotransferase MoeA [Sphingobium sp. 10 DY56-G10]|uniref:Molybdopterin molybdenumtransferase n=2 Tax=Sphingobium TaxID=165695 RepID=A0A437J3T1_9SPHN|nr:MULTISPECIES: molybdopterin molybdotransferase MoeA [Sphingomonadaceae]MEE2740833.1 molybdopterin molybdotransferase MoeA [Pseudomonadota bacterium]EAT07270.1 molybdopterin biosynthesis moea protein [Sphingomonas sp. SKA58]EQB12481.1 hypothetical protein RLDS_20315 [Sphingobium lactosutens DS20]EQB18190.1 hypothetical protein RLDS_02805 [Sphingobium lactosutens DS20]RVT39233.1 molybdopterin molybdenumtransferase MoeA [Sphingobium algorifonticola]|tara:strand:- start:2753 stop:3970 length:1218 start_codon:yes stop_codon:yes gene_type:complete
MTAATSIACAATIGFDEAQAIVRKSCVPLGFEFVPLGKAGRRVLARDVVAGIDSPRRDCAAMDGYAVHSRDLAQGVIRFRLSGESGAGGPLPVPLPPGTAVRISTGAPMPPGADRVVMREYAMIDGKHVILTDRGGKGHVRRRGDDFARGQTLLTAGTRMDARAMVVTAAADVEGVTVWRRPRVHVMTNGDELVEPGKAAMQADTVPDSLSEALTLIARQWGGKLTGMSRATDRIDSLRDAAQAALSETDILVLAGGASHGHRDLARAALLPLGLRLAFAGVAMKPGKPLWYGRIGRTHILGLPGNPTAALTTARLFLAPMIAAMSGAGFASALRWSSHASSLALEEGGDRDQFLCGVTQGNTVRTIERQQASAQMMLAQADVLVERRAGVPAGPAGSVLQCLRF